MKRLSPVRRMVRGSGVFELEQHAFAANEDRAGFRGAIVYDYGDLRALDIGGKAVKVSGGIVQVREDTIK